MEKVEMTHKQRAYQKSLIKQVHISSRYQNYYKENKDEYQDLLKDHFGVSSSKELSVSDLILLVDYLNFKSSELPSVPPPRDITKKQYEYMYGLWQSEARDKSDTALLNFVKRQTKRKINSLNKLSFEEAQKLIIALKAMLE